MRPAVVEPAPHPPYISCTQVQEIVMATTSVTDSSFQADVLGASKPVLVDFWDDWCGPCKAIAPSLEQISEELGDRVTIVKAKLDETGAAAAKFGVRAIPMLILFKNGRESARWTRGAAPRNVLQGWLEGELGSETENLQAPSNA
jgi:thioredoxin 1